MCLRSDLRVAQGVHIALDKAHPKTFLLAKPVLEARARTFARRCFHEHGDEIVRQVAESAKRHISVDGLLKSVDRPWPSPVLPGTPTSSRYVGSARPAHRVHLCAWKQEERNTVPGTTATVNRPPRPASPPSRVILRRSPSESHCGKQCPIASDDAGTAFPFDPVSRRVPVKELGGHVRGTVPRSRNLWSERDQRRPLQSVSGTKRCASSAIRDALGVASTGKNP